MARAYKKTYLNGAMRNLAVMLDCGVRKYGYPIEEFYQRFYLVGMSGAELADSVVQATGGTVLKENDGTYMVGPEYWAGWVLAYYQWLSCRSFTYMHKKGLGISEVVAMYYPLHEADLSRFAAAADDIILRNKS